jgi:3-oxoacyl-[acyl-carrier protein] reductase
MPDSHKGGLRPWTLRTPLAAIREDIDEQDTLRDASFVGGRPAYPSEIAGIVGMLCSDDSGWCTGQVICANGGMRMGF